MSCQADKGHANLGIDEETDHKASTQGGERNEHVGSICRQPSEDPSEPLLSPEASPAGMITRQRYQQGRVLISRCRAKTLRSELHYSVPNDTARTARDDNPLFSS